MKFTGNILIADDVHPALTEGLSAHGMRYDYRPDFNRADILQHISNYEGLVIRTKTRIDREILFHAHQLKWIARAGSGLDNIDEQMAAQMGLILLNAPEANADAVAEHTISLLLSVMLHTARAHQQVQQRIWKREANRGTELMGKTVGIIGFGHTGSAVAKRLSAFGVRILAHDKYKFGFGTATIIESSLDDIFREADVLTLHVPLTDETHHMVNRAFLGKFNKRIWLANLSRGPVVKTIDLVEALADGKVKGAALDVLENEQPTQLKEEEDVWWSFLSKADNVVLNPHIGGWSFESYERISTVLLQKILEMQGIEQQGKAKINF